MPDYLIFHLYGPMASWGDIAVGEYRNTADTPTRSAIFGLLAAGLGIHRDDEDGLLNLSRSYKMAVRIDAHGTRLQDFHTTQVPPESSRVRKGYPFFSRKEELEIQSTNLKTTLSVREYLHDAAWTICIWSDLETPPYSMEELTDALNAPKFVPYLGRKSCPLALPMYARVIHDKSFMAAFSATKFPDEMVNQLPLHTDTVQILWEGDPNIGISNIHTVMRRDHVTNRKRWQFSNRFEHRGVITTSNNNEEVSSHVLE